MTATRLEWLKARCALMKIRRFARAVDRDIVDERRDHACGFVSITTTRREGGGAMDCISINSNRGWLSSPSEVFSKCSVPSMAFMAKQ